ncbi:hypothetical protein [Hymenobacter cavernae]|uniref:hypothetical protein n=1 Tax=Hymenobacter cavernae TaxID=2044852 RepID=UPI0016682A22|nr:hypothetical protein [Hymenobacter cavernae]
MTFTDLLDRTAELYFIVPLAAASLRKDNLPLPSRLVYWFLCALVISYILRRAATLVLHNNLFSYHLFTVIELFFISEVYYHLLPSRRIRLGIRSGQILFIPIAIADATLSGGLVARINTYANTYAGTILVALSILHLFNLADSASKDLRTNPYFIFSAATLLNSTLSTAIHTSSYFSDFSRTNLFQRLIEAFPFINALYMGLLTYMFSLFKLAVDPRDALPWWLHFVARRRVRTVEPPRTNLA